MFGSLSIGHASSGVAARVTVAALLFMFGSFLIYGTGFAGASVLAGLVILAGSIAATRFRRVREAAIFKALGATRSVLLRSLAIEYLMLGLVAGCVGTAVGAGLAWAVLTLVLGIPWHAPLAVMLGLPAATAVLTVVVGVGALLGVIAEKPLAVLRLNFASDGPAPSGATGQSFSTP